MSKQSQIEDLYPLTPLQEGILFHSLLAPGEGMYVGQMVVELEGELDAPTFRRAWEGVVARHAALRTGFAWEGVEKPLQVVRRSVRLPWVEEDWRGVPEAGHEARLQAALAAERSGLDPTRAPLMRVLLARTGERAHRLLWTHHQMAFDGWSLPIVYGDVAALYRAAREGTGASLPPAPSYRRYVEWLAGRDAAADERFWRERLGSFAAATPLAMLRPAAAQPDWAHASHELAPARGNALSAFARGRGITAATLFQGAWALLLARAAGEEDVLFGSVVSGRPAALEGAGETVGMFLNTVAVRVHVDAAETAGDFLARLQADAAAAAEHEHTPLVQAQRASRVPAGEPLFESLLVFNNYPRDSAFPGGSGAGALRVHVRNAYEKANYPLTLSGSLGDGLRLELDYDRARLDPAAAHALLVRLAGVMVAMAAAPGAPLGALPTASADERARALALGAGEDAPALHVPASFLEMWDAQVAARPAAPAAVCEDGTLTYAELDARAARLARRLVRMGVAGEDRVALLLERGADVAVATLAVLKAGAAYLPLDPAYPPERLAFTLADAGARVLLTHASLRARVAADGVQVVELDTARVETDADDAAPLPLATDRRRLAYVIYTSGSTGRPKGVMVEHGELAHYAGMMAARLGLTPGDRVLQFASPAFDVVVEELFPAWAAGAAVVFSRADLLNPEALDRVVREHGVTAFELPTAYWHEWVRERAESGRALPASVRMVLVGGERVLPERLRDWAAAGVPLVHVFGLTETTVTTTTLRVEPGEAAPRGDNLPVGTPVAGARVYVLDPCGHPQPQGTPGEMWIGGTGPARGYLGRPALTAERFVPDPFSGVPGARAYRTGDRVRWRDDGTLEFLGRIDRQARVRGHRVEPAEVEAALAEHPAVAAAAVAVREDAPGERRLVAYVTPAAGYDAAPGAGALRAFLAERLPGHMVPAAFTLLEALPLTPSGKVDRRALPAPGVSADAHAQASRPAGEDGRTPTEQAVAAAWAEVLGVQGVRLDDNFFALGGDSLLLLRAAVRVRSQVGRAVSLAEILQHRTLRALAAALDGTPPETASAPAPRASTAAAPESRASTAVGRGRIAIVALAGRFPGADGVDALWRNLREGVDSISELDDEALAGAGVPRRLRDDPRYVRAAGVLRDVERFDADFFGFSPREAELLGPQHRLFLECAWEALESAGYDPAAYPGRIGVYSGADPNFYWVRALRHPALRGKVGGMQVQLGAETDFVPTQVSYRLGLEGPSLNVQTACSSSLVAVHLACRALLAGESDMMLAGGVSVTIPQSRGYLYEEGGPLSPTGRCRAFDADARGTVGGSGAGVVVLKRLEDALADGDTVHAVVLGSALSNDGAAKAGFTAPGLRGQARAVADALAAAGVHPDTVGYVEGHGTGTEAGDPVEVAALTRAFREGTQRVGYCALGSVKTNVGHLDAAAGVTGLIKAVMALRHAEIPPTLHHERANPHAGLAESPFHVNTRLRSWDRGDSPRRAGVSSFGIGGTNAHVVLEEAPAPPAAQQTQPAARPFHLLPLSARSPAALDEAAARLAAHLRAHPGQTLHDVAHTLALGRRHFAHRRAFVCADRDEAIARLEGGWGVRGPAPRSDGERPVAFLFPGLGDDYPWMGRGLYEAEPAFRAAFDRAAKAFRPHLDADLHRVVRASADAPAPRGGTDFRGMVLGAAAPDALPPTLAHAALFAVEHALAETWASWGVVPRVVAGHSLGEYAAACTAGVFTLEDAAALVAERARLVEALPEGALLAVPLSEAELRPMLEGPLALAAVNAPGLCTVAGPRSAVDALAERLGARGVTCRRLRSARAAHSPLLAPAAERLGERVARMRLAAPSIPLVSGTTGRPLSPAEATDPAYWARHLCETVRFADALDWLLADGERVLVEMGPGRALSAFALAAGAPEPLVAASMRHVAVDAHDGSVLLEALGRVWAAGARVDWSAFAAPGSRRIPLPTYPFERRRFWIDEPPRGARRSMVRAGAPAWVRAPSAPRVPDEGARFLVASGPAAAEAIGRALQAEGSPVARVEPGGLRDALAGGSGALRLVVVAVTDAGAGETAEMALGRASDALEELAGVLRAGGPLAPVAVDLVTRGAWEVTGGDAGEGEARPLREACRRLRREHGVRWRAVDLPAGDPGSLDDATEMARVAAELRGASGDGVVALRGPFRWVRGRVAVPAPQDGTADEADGAAPLPESPVADAADAHPRPGLSTPFRTPGSEAERQVAAAFGEVLAVADVGADDDFFALGGHSLLGVQVLARLREACGAVLGLADLFTTPTVAGLAGRMEAAEREIASGVPPVGKAPPGAVIPASFGQERLWALSRLQPDSPYYNVVSAQYLDGALDAAVLERSIREMVRRHEALRTLFSERDGRPVPWVGPVPGRVLEVADLTHLPPAERAAETQRRLAEELRRPTCLERGPVFRGLLLRTESAEHALVLTVHHAAIDGWSWGVFWRELPRIYEAFSRGEPSPLADPALQYGDYALWQREWMTGEVIGRHLDFWQGHLAGAPAGLDLPADRPRPPVQSHRGAVHLFRIPQPLSARLKAFSRQEGVTLHVVLLAAFHVLLLRLTGRDDQVVGSLAANRTHRETEGTIGYFLNTLALRTRLDGDPDFRTLLRRVHETMLAADAHQYVPFDRVLEHLAPPRDPARHPLFGMMFILQRSAHHGARAAVPGLERRGFELDNRTTKFDLSLLLDESGDALDGLIEYAADLFDQPTVARLGALYTTLVEALVEAPEARVGQVRLLDPAERRRLLEAGSREPVASYPAAEGTLHGRFEVQAARHPRAVAVEAEDERLTYGELNTWANRVASTLRAEGVGPGAVVGVCVERGTAMVAVLLGVLKTGAAYLPLDPAHPAERLDFMLRDAGAARVVAGAGVARTLPAGAWSLVPVPAHPAEDDGNGWAGTDPAELAYVIYTSGSTGRPKGVEVTHGGASAFLAAMLREPGLRPDDAVLATATLSFDISVLEIFLPLSVGARVVVATRDQAADPPALAALLERHGVTLMQATPSTWRLLLEAGWAGRGDLRVLSGGEALPPAMAGALRARTAEVWNVYGPTEATVWATAHRVAAADEGERVPVGRPLQGVLAYVLDGAGELAPAGFPGELHLGGAGVARGYRGGPGLTAASYLPDPFGGCAGARMYRTGDRARWRADGTLEFLGRADRQVKVRGHRVELGEVEDRLARHPRVADAAVAAVEDAPGEVRLAAYVVGRGESPAPAELRAWVRQALPESMVPHAFVTLDALPRTPTGKVDRRALPAPHAERAPVPAEPPRTPVEAALARAWAAVLGGEQPGIHDDFFELGGDSIRAIQVVARARSEGVHLLPRHLFEHPTVARLAEQAVMDAGPAACMELTAPGDDGASRGAGGDSPSRFPLAGLAPEALAELLEGRGAVEDLYPATPLQEGMLFHVLYAPDSTAYAGRLLYELEGPLEPAHVAQAWRLVMERHPVLRTAFLSGDDGAFQAVLSGIEPPVELADWRALGEAERGVRLRTHLDGEGVRPFSSPGEAPLFRVWLFRTGERRHLLSWSFHQLVLDGWSVELVFRDVAQAVADLGAGREPRLPPSRPFRDYVAWLGERDPRPAERFWRGLLAGHGGATPLLPDAAREPEPAAWGDRVLSAEDTAALGALSRSCGLTPSTLVQGAWALLLARRADVGEVIFGVVMSGRPAELDGVEEMAGVFINTLPMRVHAGADDRVRPWLQGLQRLNVDAREHEHAPLVEVHRWAGCPRGESLFESIVAFENFPTATLPAGGEPQVRLSRIHDEQRTHYPLALTASLDQVLALRVTYDSGRFRAETVDRMLDGVVRALRAFAADPEARLGEVPVWRIADEDQEIGGGPEGCCQTSRGPRGALSS